MVLTHARHIGDELNAEPVTPPLRSTQLVWILPFAVVLAPLLWVAIPLMVAADLHRVACPEAYDAE